MASNRNTVSPIHSQPSLILNSTTTSDVALPNSATMVSEQCAGRKSLASTVEEVTITYNMLLALALDRGHTDGWPRLSQLRCRQQEFLDWVEASGAGLESSLPGSLSYQYYDRPDIYSKFTEGAMDLYETLKRSG